MIRSNDTERQNAAKYIETLSLPEQACLHQFLKSKAYRQRTAEMLKDGSLVLGDVSSVATLAEVLEDTITGTFEPLSALQLTQ